MEYLIIGYMIFSFIMCIYSMFVIRIEIKIEREKLNKPTETKVVERIIKEKAVPIKQIKTVKKESSKNMIKPEIIIKNPNQRPVMIRSVKYGDQIHNVNQIVDSTKTKIDFNDNKVNVVSLDK